MATEENTEEKAPAPKKAPAKKAAHAKEPADEESPAPKAKPTISELVKSGRETYNRAKKIKEQEEVDELAKKIAGK